MNKIIQSAIERKDYSYANLLIHQFLNDENKDSIFDFIETAELAFEFMILDPRNTELIFHNPRIRILIEQWENTSEGHIHYYKAAGRRPSFYVEIDKITGESTVFNKGMLLGSGSYGEVVDFISETKEHRAVKYLKNMWVDYAHNVEVEDAYRCHRKEQILRKKAYPGVNSLFFFWKTIQDHEKQTTQYSIRGVTDFIDGEALHNFFPKIKSVHEILNLFILIIDEIIVLHKKGIIHGDIKANNVMIFSKNGDIKVKLIDFGNAFLLTDKSSPKYYGDPIEHKHIPPECFPESFKVNKAINVTPNVNFDIYSVGDMFRWLLDSKNHKSNKQTIDTLLPSIRCFIDQALDENPSNRPSLDDFRKELSNAHANFISPIEEIGYCAIS